MGGTCTKMLASNQPVTSRAVVQKQMVPVLPGGVSLEGDVSNVTEGHELVKDAFSKGDFIRDETQDKQSESNELPVTRENKNSIPKESSSQRDSRDEIDSNASNGTPLAPNGSSDEHIVRENPSDGNSQHKTKIKEGEEPRVDDNKEQVNTETDKDKITTEDGQVKDNDEEKQNCGDDGSKSKAEDSEKPHLDSLYFIQLSANAGRPPTPHKLVERLQNKPRKPALMTYDERMLLADLNRFEQLDKRREFAVRRNRSVTRNGKLPKISDVHEVTPEDSSNSMNNPTVPAE